MDSAELLLAAIGAFGCLAAVASPVVVLLSRARYSPDYVAGGRRMLWASAFVVAVASCHVANVSLSLHDLNVVLVAFAVVVGLFLAGFSFVLRPRAVGIVSGGCALVAWLMLMLYASLGALLGGAVAGREIALSDGIVCRQAGYGIVGSESGSHVSAFRRFLFVDQRIAARRYSIDGPYEDDLVYPDKPVLRRCIAALSAAPTRGI